ncbi:MAG: ATP-binding protein [Lachnospiraceae bacterium]|nr:ATP-binding protein [Lachnospiraceae bacterium]
MGTTSIDRPDEELRSITLPAELEKLEAVQDFVEAIMEEGGAGMKVICTVNIAVEEMFVNVCHYAYGEDGGEVKVEAGIISQSGLSDNEGAKAIRIRLTDSGIPYDPLAKEDPDITLPAEERPIGGLGIYMVKKSMDRVSYEYKDGKNIFTMEKGI